MGGKQPSRRTPAPADILAALDDIRAALDTLRALIVADAPAAADATEHVVDDEPEWASLAAAAALCRVHPDTMANRCRINGLGWRPGGRDYRVDMVRVRRWQEGKPYERLPADVPREPGRTRKLPDDRAVVRSQIEGPTRRTSK